MQTSDIPEYLLPSYQVLIKTYPNGIEDDDYYVLLSMLHQHYSDRNLALLISLFTGKDMLLIYCEDIPKAAFHECSPQEKKRVESLLEQNGATAILFDDTEI